jgi:hypothetical protein
MEMVYALSSAANVPDVFRYRTIIDAQKYDGAWLTDTLDWTGLLTPNNVTTTAITYAENQAGFTAKRFTVDLGSSWLRPNLVALQSAFSGGTPAFVLTVERSVNNSTWTTIFNSAVNRGLVYVLQNDAADSRYFRFTVTLSSSLGVGVALAFSKLIGFAPRLNGSNALQPFSTDYSRNTTFNGHLLFAGGKYLHAQDGSASAASLAFASETNTGLYRSGTNTIGFTTAGTQRATLSSTAFTLASGVGLSVASTATVGSTLAVTGASTFSNELIGWDSYSAIHSGTVDTFWEVSQRLQAIADTSSTTCMELEVMTTGASYGALACITRWQINTRAAVYVTRYEENGGAGNCTLRILSDNSKANSIGVRDRFVVGVTFSNTYQMAYMRVRYTNGLNGRWTNLVAKATSTPTTVSGSAMTYSGGWVANTGYTVEAFTETLVAAKFSTLNLTSTLTGVAATLTGTLTGVAAALSGDLTVRSTALVVGSRGTSITSSIASGVSANEGGLRLITQMTANDSGFHKIGIWNEYNLSGSGHATQRTAIWNTVSASSADTFSNVVGQYMYFSVGNASGVVSAYSALVVASPQATGTVTVHTGLNLADVASSQVGTAYGIYSAMGNTGGTRYFINHAGVAPSIFSGLVTGTNSSGSSSTFASKITGNANNCLELTAGGTINFGSGSGATDTNLYRLGANFLATDDSLYVANDLGVGVTSPQGKLHINGRLHFTELASDPVASSLTSDAAYNYKDRAAVYVKNDKFVLAYNHSGTVYYITIPLNGPTATTTWTHSTTAP